LDSLGDHLTFLIGLAGLLSFEFNFIKENYLIILIALIPYVIQVFIAYKKYGKATAFHTYLAKLSAFIQGVFILWALFFSPVYWMFYFMIVLGLLETLEEITLIFMHKNWVSDVKGIYWALHKKRNNTTEEKKS
jgi:CDP-diacylglycerol--glycerol-3-phosphate 3-phosphatidyltransferase